MPEGGNWKDLVKAADAGNAHLVRYHLANGVDPNFQHPEYFTAPIFEAIRKGHLEVVKILVEEGNANPALIEEMTDDTAIEVALSSKKFEIVDYLNEQLPLQQRLRLRQIFVTDGTTLMGKQLVEKLLSQGHTVLFGSDLLLGQELQEELVETTGNTKVQWLGGANLPSSTDHVRELAIEVRQRMPRLDAVIHTSCLWTTERSATTDEALDLSFRINYMTRHLWDELFTPLLKEHEDSRIVYVGPAEQLPLRIQPDILTTPFGKDFHWSRTYTKTMACSICSFRNTVESTKGTTVTVSMMACSKNDYSVFSIGSMMGGGLLSTFLRYFHTCWMKSNASEIVETIEWLLSETNGSRHHGKIYHGRDQETSTIPNRTTSKEWQEWTSDFLSRS